MASITSCNQERAEVEAVLQSGIFSRAPNLESFFRYICECHLRGEADQLKEYSIAVEALGRGQQFDQKKDAIVRVEAHRLRKRLTVYYAGPGADHGIHICIPRGSYAPQFVAPQPETVPLEMAPVQVPLETRWPKGTRWPLAIGMSLLAIVLVFSLGKTSHKVAAQNAAEVWRQVPGQAIPAEYRILTGYHGEPVVDYREREWRADAFYDGGQSVALAKNATIQGMMSPVFFRSMRTGKFKYDIPVTAGVFEIHLYFAETEFGLGNPKGGGDGSRLFRLSINGGNTIDLFDVHSQAGPNRLLVRVFKDISRLKDGKIHIAFDPVGSSAFVNAIEILPGSAGKIRPIRIVAQDHSVTDSDGRVWSGDDYVVGGTLVLRRDAQFQHADFGLYRGERFGNFTYHLPLAPGKYRVTLHFAETWFGTPSASFSAERHRLFDVYANGLALLRKFDPLADAGGPNKGIEKVFEGLEPNAQGELVLQFLPVSNYAEINAIEVIETE